MYQALVYTGNPVNLENLSKNSPNLAIWTFAGDLQRPALADNLLQPPLGAFVAAKPRRS